MDSQDESIFFLFHCIGSKLLDLSWAGHSHNPENSIWKKKRSELLELKSVISLNWVSWLQGGGWCNNIKSCVFRKTTRRGSSKYMEKTLAFTGILSNKAEENPGPDSNYWFPFQQWLCLLLLLYILLRFYSWSFSPLCCRFFQLEQSQT